ncbi:MAG: maltose alpha-D-glucosyltransferase [Spirochaetaceae bacterium]|nr:MAG: maltose alpha-D-glucosyltransferase [Spirochaetaceae bacterium]
MTASDPLWYKDAVIYELHIKSFFDSNNDGIGDIQGVIRKLDYVQDLGVSALWLLPFYPSPLLDDGYDISDYFSINRDYGTLADFRKLLREAHRRDIRVITELVINHTSDQHRWFQRSRRAKPGSVHRDYYVWSDTPDKYLDARIIFTDFESSNWSWDPVAQAYYWHRFYHHQPDLNYDNPRVCEEIFAVLDYWFEMGVDALRLDAIPYLFERDDTNCENLPETHAFLKALRAHMDARFSDKMLLAEANQWPEDAAEYFGDGDECHMGFHFPIMPRLFMSLRMEDRFPIMDMLEQSLDIPENCQWGMFLRNHDELTLEMVTDEERDYMYKAYAQDPRARINVGIRRRLAPLLDNNRRRIELLNCLLFALPGTPILYYGDEIGMGDNYYLGDRDGVRTPMQWSPDRNAGFSQANPQSLYLPVIVDSEYHYSTVNVENQSRNLSSLLWFMRRALAVRKQYRVFGRGTIEFLASDNPCVLTFVRRLEEENILVVANLSRHGQAVTVQMPDFSGYRVTEIFSDNDFPPITDAPYTLTMAPHSFYWFDLRPAEQTGIQESDEALHIECNSSWARVLGTAAERDLVAVIRKYLTRVRWFGGKGRTIRRLSFGETLTIGAEDQTFHVLRLDVLYAKGTQQSYLLPLGFAVQEQEASLLREAPQGVIAYLKTRDHEGIVYDAVYSSLFRAALLDAIAQKRNKRFGSSRLVAHRGSAFARMLGHDGLPRSSQVLKTEQSNTSVFYGNQFFLKLYRRLEDGVNPDVELTRVLTEQTAFRNLPAYAGSVEWHPNDGKPVTIGLLQQCVANETDGWSYALHNVEQALAHAQTLSSAAADRVNVPDSIFGLDPDTIPDAARDFIGPVFVEMVAILGRRTAELHIALASLSGEPDLTPEPFSLLYQKSLQQSIRGMILKVFGQLEDTLPRLAAETAEPIRSILARKRTVLARLRRIGERKIVGLKIRTHGDYHLGQTLHTGKDFMIIDFEGEPARSMTERRLKQSALRDVAGMIRSFHYAAHGANLLRAVRHGADINYLTGWADVWYSYVGGVFLHAYRAAVVAQHGAARFIPEDPGDFAVLLETFLLEKAVYELGYEMNNRPEWLIIPVRGLEALLGEE